MYLKLPPRWALPESAVTPRSVYDQRRTILRDLRQQGLVGKRLTRRELLGGVAASAGLAGCGLSVEGLELDSDLEELVNWESPYARFFPAPQNSAYEVPERALTDAVTPTRYNNFYEFTTAKDGVWQLVGDFEVEPWTIEVGGLCNNPGTFGVEELFELFDLEERIYRFRCVEAWAMTVPWSGFPLARLLEHVDPRAEATHVAFISENDPEQMPGVDALSFYPWPYHEGLRIDEAMNALTFLVGGLYGEPLPRQNGAPLRLIVPWKYGYKSIKSIVRIQLLDHQPETFWSTLAPQEYPFESNVDPDVPHSRWSQASERLIPDNQVVDTLVYNGYADEVAGLYR
ncbi:MAG: protein-methionine-sulfoxide reductase catalytic subunit MsrP [Alphaproteobacteria bacterium]|nr:protein-methionine-sulfoxide reductase catalytic subunit MsrP [Alphaproteobacteria bacterium]